ncbi:hypothetical protein WJX75_000164 [Coccomyxa subellipsoidea]|uniref:Uncharacterized protein n=1 Tax=Coccomyxa subellipsoidea TaxID=248742 RepID=A0ABR2YHF7_9CHLO
MNKNLASIEKHIQGKKYRRAKELYDQGEFELIVEPELLEEEESEEEEAEALLDTNGGAHSSHMADRDEEAGVQTDEVLEAQETHAKSTAAACKSPKGRKQKPAQSRKKRQKADLDLR